MCHHMQTAVFIITETLKLSQYYGTAFKTKYSELQVLKIQR